MAIFFCQFVWSKKHSGDDWYGRTRCLQTPEVQAKAKTSKRGYQAIRGTLAVPTGSDQAHAPVRFWSKTPLRQLARDRAGSELEQLFCALRTLPQAVPKDPEPKHRAPPSKEGMLEAMLGGKPNSEEHRVQPMGRQLPNGALELQGPSGPTEEGSSCFPKTLRVGCLWLATRKHVVTSLSTSCGPNRRARCR